MTPYGGLADWRHYIEKVGIVGDLTRRFPVARTSPNATPVGDIPHGFMINGLMGGRRLAHMRRSWMASKLSSDTSVLAQPAQPAKLVGRNLAMKSQPRDLGSKLPWEQKKKLCQGWRADFFRHCRGVGGAL